MKSKTQTARELNIDLIKRYRAGDGEAGEELASINQALVYSIAERFSHSPDELSELCECGNIGLVKAINSFDLSRECAFSTYAVPLIYGEIRRFLRDDGPIKVSRDDKRMLARVLRVREELRAMGEVCTLAKIAEGVGATTEDVAVIMSIGSPVRSLDERVGEDEDAPCLSAVVCDENEEIRAFDKLSVKMAIEKLSPEHRKIIILRYFRDMSQTECAEALGLSQVKISREEKKIISILKNELS